MGYNIPISSQNRTAVKRKVALSSLLAPGSGTIYSWDWLWSQANRGQSPSNLDSNSIHFRYVGLATQMKTSDRIGQHISEAKGSGKLTEDRTMYTVLSQAFKEESGYFTSKESSIKSDGGEVVSVIHNVSLFDLANLEKYYISKQARKNDASNFADIVQKSNMGSMFSLNTSAGGEGDPVTGGGAAGEMEFIIAAYMYLREQDPEVKAARQLSNITSANHILQKTNNNYREAIKMLIDEHRGLSRIDTSKESFDLLLSQFLSKLKNTNIKEEQTAINKTPSADLVQDIFGGSAVITMILNYNFEGLKFEGIQQNKAIFLKESFSVGNLFSESEVKEMHKKIADSTDRIKREKIIEGATKKISAAYVREVDKLFQEVERDLLTSTRVANDNVAKFGFFNKLLKAIQKKSTLKTITKDFTELVSGNMKNFEAQAVKDNKQFLSSETRTKMFMIVEEYILTFYNVVGYPPSPTQIAQTLGEAKKDNVNITLRITERFTKKS